MGQGRLDHTFSTGEQIFALTAQISLITSLMEHQDNRPWHWILLDMVKDIHSNCLRL